MKIATSHTPSSKSVSSGETTRVEYEEEEEEAKLLLLDISAADSRRRLRGGGCCRLGGAAVDSGWRYMTAAPAEIKKGYIKKERSIRNGACRQYEDTYIQYEATYIAV